MISSFALFGALETGFIFALVALGIFISINLRIMDGPNKALLGVDTLLTPLDNLSLPY